MQKSREILAWHCYGVTLLITGLWISCCSSISKTMGSWTCHWTALLLSMLICTLGMENTCDVRTGWKRKTYEWRFSSGGPPQIRVSFLAVFHYHQTSSRHLTTAPTEWIQSVVKDAAWVGRGSALSYDPQANHSPWSFSHGDRQACTKLAL